MYCVVNKVPSQRAVPLGVPSPPTGALAPQHDPPLRCSPPQEHQWWENHLHLAALGFCKDLHSHFKEPVQHITVDVSTITVSLATTIQLVQGRCKVQGNYVNAMIQSGSPTTHNHGEEHTVDGCMLRDSWRHSDQSLALIDNNKHTLYCCFPSPPVSHACSPCRVNKTQIQNPTANALKCTNSTPRLPGYIQPK